MFTISDRRQFKAFNFNVIEIDPMTLIRLQMHSGKAKSTKGMPTAIIAKSIKGKGVSFMENQQDGMALLRMMSSITGNADLTKSVRA